MSMEKSLSQPCGSGSISKCVVTMAPELPEPSRAMLASLIERHHSHWPETCKISFRIDTALLEETFTISGTETIAVSGGSVRALFYGLGKVLREKSFRGTDAPSHAARAIYFATHFNNYYDHASEQELRDYVGDLALWGCNEIAVWFDMHHFHGMDDPAAKAKVTQLRQIFMAAHDCGMHGSLDGLSNEAFAGSPEALRADWKGGKNNYRHDLVGHYHVEICPSVPGGLELILRWRDEVYAAFTNCGVDRVMIGTYDQGGCTCAKCAPYGANGKWKIIPGYIEIARKYFPNCQVGFATWRYDIFTYGEWDDLFRRGEALKKDFSYLCVDAYDAEKVAKSTPGGLPVVIFSEISMNGMLPWGGFGANPQPEYFDREMHKCASCAGIRPYSEGIYEDMNKVLLLDWCWKARPMVEILGDYMAFYFGEENRAKGVEAALLLEKNLAHNAVVVQNDKRLDAYSATRVDPTQPWHLEYEMKKLDGDRAEKALALLNACRIPEKTAASWRWRVFYLRAVIDAKLARMRSINDELEELFQLYHVTEKTISCLVPPSVPRWRKVLAKPVTEHV